MEGKKKENENAEYCAYVHRGRDNLLLFDYICNYQISLINCLLL